VTLQWEGNEERGRDEKERRERKGWVGKREERVSDVFMR
jgi:hypothetical protein